MITVLDVQTMKIAQLKKLLTNRFRRKSFPRAGRRAHIDPTAQFIGCDYIEIGNRSIIAEGCWFNVNDRSGGKPRIVIGDHCIISRRTFMSSGHKITVGPYCLIGNENNFLGADHDFTDPFVPYLIAPAINGEEISVGANCWVGSNCTILKGVQIGHGCVIGAGSLVAKSVPPLSIAVGNPCRVLRRFRVRERRWVSLSEWTAEDETQVPDEGEYLALIRKKHPWLSMPYIISGPRYGNL